MSTGTRVRHRNRPFRTRDCAMATDDGTCTAALDRSATLLNELLDSLFECHGNPRGSY